MLIGLFFKETKVYITIVACFQVVGQALKIGSWPVLYDQQAIGIKEIIFKNQCVYFRNICQLVGWVCKYKIKRSVGAFQVFKHIGSFGKYIT